MKKLIAAALVLALALALTGCWTKAQPSPSPTAAPTPDATGRGETVVTAEPGTEPTNAPPATPEPAETFSPAPEPSPDATPEPTEEPAPTEEPVIVNPSVQASGSFRSDTGTALNLVADWRIASVSDTVARITVTLYLESYSLDIGERRGNLLSFNGEDWYFITDAVEITGGDFVKTQIYVWSKELDASDLSFELYVRWNLRGSYSKKEMEAIELSGSYEG